jgi:four helix bundle protein
MANYRDLIVFQKADELSFQIYKLTDTFPKSEIFGLTSQLRRAALSVPTNIVEGYAQEQKGAVSIYHYCIRLACRDGISLQLLKETRLL